MLTFKKNRNDIIIVINLQISIHISFTNDARAKHQFDTLIFLICVN